MIVHPQSRQFMYVSTKGRISFWIKKTFSREWIAVYLFANTRMYEILVQFLGLWQKNNLSEPLKKRVVLFL